MVLDFNSSGDINTDLTVSANVATGKTPEDLSAAAVLSLFGTVKRQILAVWLRSDDSDALIIYLLACSMLLGKHAKHLCYKHRLKSLVEAKKRDQLGSWSNKELKDQASSGFFFHAQSKKIVCAFCDYSHRPRSRETVRHTHGCAFNRLYHLLGTGRSSDAREILQAKAGLKHLVDGLGRFAAEQRRPCDWLSISAQLLNDRVHPDRGSSVPNFERLVQDTNSVFSKLDIHFLIEYLKTFIGSRA